MKSTLASLVSFMTGQCLWHWTPSLAERLVIRQRRGLLTRSATKYYLASVVPWQASREYLSPPENDPLEQFVVDGDFQAAREIIADMGYEEDGILPPETVVLHALVRTFQPDAVLESGTYRGQSAVALCNALQRSTTEPRFHTVSPNEDGHLRVARSRLARFPFAEVSEGYSQEVFPKLLEDYASQRLGVFVDGPKASDGAFPQLLSILDRPEQIDFIAIHDCEFPEPVCQLATATPRWIKLERLRIERWFRRSRIRDTHELIYMGTPWCHRHAEVWNWLPSRAPRRVGSHYFSNQQQLSATPVLAMIVRRDALPTTARAAIIRSSEARHGK